jgi:hypothetical protein
VHLQTGEKSLALLESSALGMPLWSVWVIYKRVNGMVHKHLRPSMYTHIVLSFLNMDYVIFDSLRNCKLNRVAFTYDIYCKWSIHAEERARKHFPPEMVNDFLRMHRRGFVPKLHLYAHGKSCRTVWSLNYHQQVGRTDGESTERDWASAVLAALQTGEMNAGTRHGALDDHWIDKNFRRMLGLSICLQYLSDEYGVI